MMTNVIHKSAKHRPNSNECESCFTNGCESVKKNYYNQMKKMLLDNGFEVVRESKHLIVARNGKQVAVSRKIIDPDRILKKCMKETDITHTA